MHNPTCTKGAYLCVTLPKQHTETERRDSEGGKFIIDTESYEKPKGARKTQKASGCRPWILVRILKPQSLQDQVNLQSLQGPLYK